MDLKEEISDSDSGIILNSGPDSPTSPVKDLSTHTRAVRLKQQALEDRLDLCFQELKKLCIKEAELTGKLPHDYPLLPNEKLPLVRRRVGAAFKLDEGLLSPHGEASKLHTLQADLALQRQIYEASRRLALEDHLSKPVRKRRLQQCKQEEKKLKELQEAVLKHCANHGCVSPQNCRASKLKDMYVLDDSSLSDAAAHDEDLETAPLSPISPDSGARFQRILLSTRQGQKQSGSNSSLQYERSPIQNTPWRESSLDHPYLQQRKQSSASSSRSSSSPAGTSVDLQLDDIPPAPHFVFKSLAMHVNNSTSAPSTPELPLRRHISQSFRLPRTDIKMNSDLSRGRTKLPRRRVTDFALAYSVQRLYQCSSEDSSSEQSISSYSSSSSHEYKSETAKPCPPPYRNHHVAQNNSQSQHTATKFFLKNTNQNQTKQINRQSEFKSNFERKQELKLQENCIGKLSMALLSSGKQQQKDLSSPKQMIKPPPAYSSLARTTSLKEYPNHHSRVFPRDMVTTDLKSWHQRNNFGEKKLRPEDQHVSRNDKCLLKQGPPPYHQIQSQTQAPHKIILQTAADGTPLQWYEGNDGEIVSQV